MGRKPSTRTFHHPPQEEDDAFMFIDFIFSKNKKEGKDKKKEPVPYPSKEILEEAARESEDAIAAATREFLRKFDRDIWRRFGRETLIEANFAKILSDLIL